MSSWAVTCATALAVLGSAEAMAAQERATLPGEAELLARIEALGPQLDSAQAAALLAKERAAQEAAARPGPATRLVRVGPVRVLSPADQADLAEELFTQVWRDHFQLFAESPSLAAHLFVFRWSWGSADPLRVDPDSGPVRRVELDRAWARSADMARLRIRDALWEVVLRDLPEGSPLHTWLARAPYPRGQQTARLATVALSMEGRSCLEGGATACVTLLEGADGGVHVPKEVAASLVLEAMGIGGEGTWRRLVERAESPPLEALAAAAGVDGERLLVLWRTSLLAETPESYAGLGGRAGRLTLWLMLFVGCTALSTRWRLS